MKILLINSSPRKNGATAKILNEISTILNNYSDVEANIIHLSEKKLEFCKGCTNCYRTGECFLEDDGEKISKLISESDALVVGSPTYASSITGQMKTLIDRGHFVIEQLLYKKYTLSVSTYENADGKSVIKFLNKLFLYSGGILCGNLCVKTVFNENPLNNELNKDKVKYETEKLYNMLKNKSKGNILNRIIHGVVFNVGIKPFVLKEKSKYSGVLNHWNGRGVLNATV